MFELCDMEILCVLHPLRIMLGDFIVLLHDVAVFVYLIIFVGRPEWAMRPMSHQCLPVFILDWLILR